MAPFSGGSPMISPEIPFIPTPFNPTSLITGNGGFWRADMGVTQSAGVTAWADQSSFANNLAFDTTKPSFSSTGFNSAKPGITMTDAGSTALAFSFLTGSFSSTTVSGFFLIQENAQTQSFGRIFTVLNGSDDFNTTSSFELDVGNNSMLNVTNNSAQQGNGGSVGPAITNTNLYLFGVVFDGAHSSRWSAGAAVGAQTANTNTIGGAGTTSFWLGADNGKAHNSTGCTFAFAGLTYKAMSSTDWTNLKNWSNSNWGTSF